MKVEEINMYWEDEDCYYEEPNEFAEKCEELLDMIRSSANKEIKEHMKSLEAENTRMKDIVENYDSKVRELERVKQDYEWKESKLRSEIEFEMKRKRLSEILEGFYTTLWVVGNNPKAQPKCDKCDEHRRIHFKSPSGKDCTEPCECSKETPFYIAEELECVEFKISDWDNSRRGKLVGWYSLKNEGTDDEYYRMTYFCCDHMYEGQNYEDIKKCFDIYFETKEEAQKYADWLNERVEEN